MAEYLDKTGLTYLWSKIKAKFDAKADKTALDAKADKTALDAKADKTTADALGKRIDNLILSSGTESSAEVIDARTGYDGKAYDTLGTAIRTQVNDLNKDLDYTRSNETIYKELLHSAKDHAGTYYNHQAGGIAGNSNTKIYDGIALKANQTVLLHDIYGYFSGYKYSDGIWHVFEETSTELNISKTFTPTEDCTLYITVSEAYYSTCTAILLNELNESALSIQLEPYLNKNKPITLDESSNLKEAIENAKDGATIYIKSGTYDISYLINGTEVKISKNIKIIGLGLVIIKCVRNSQDTFNSIFRLYNADITIENITFDATNCRYCVHDENGGTTNGYVHKYLNCNFYQRTAESDTWKPRCIGAGVGDGAYIIIDKCEFNDTYDYCVSVHANYNAKQAKRSVIKISNCYANASFSVEGINGVTQGSTENTDMFCSNNVVKTEPRKTGADTNLYSWNNIIK